MSADNSDGIETILRIPGKWSGPDELNSRLPAGYRLTPQQLQTPDGSQIHFSCRQPDQQFAQVFRGSCRVPAKASELEIVDHYRVNVCLIGPGGSLAATRTMMAAGAAIIRAGAGGVFIDNSGLSHGASSWLEMADDGGADALSFAFVNIIRGKKDIWTMGMHVLGYPDLTMPRGEPNYDQETMIDTLRYVVAGLKPIGDGHVLADEFGPRYQVRAIDGDHFSPDSPMHNPFGRLKLISFRSLAEKN